MKRPIFTKHSSIFVLGAVVLISCSFLLAPAPARSSESLNIIAATSSSLNNAQNGKELYEMNCLSCHAAEGKGIDKYPSLVSDHAKNKLSTYDKAFEFISRNMPQNAPGSLREDDYKAITNYILSLNGIPTGFNDIEGHWAQKEINELFDKKFIDGYIDKQAGTMSFKPNQNITRAEFIRYLVKAKELFLSNSTDSEFKDIADTNKDKVYIITAVEYGLINGYPDQTFRPMNSITRAEIATILSRSEMLKASSTSSFTDVAADYWAGDAIRAVQQAHLFNGYEDGSFRPDFKLTRSEAVAVIYRLIHPVS
ncbi:S-layer homology domain-containing protein [Paenibacillus radicis (ex Xue et al. 2023)]|uniref:S-layer homology domain-containing protein n=1 Tax=Paenibacillus radicis (ex Xue et al. 2023) TaxID=2972489 RepID=A0ABT1YK43_9BACL|nr:S-layer homology domain-containing protein [Paenibacillus radicis (ex Xue et al. 2023)]MCR8633549.1 S-layer homology domain-containing protein [Paenibacillus radicis (ex Xue et al. 2023)]